MQWIDAQLGDRELQPAPRQEAHPSAPVAVRDRPTLEIVTAPAPGPDGALRLAGEPLSAYLTAVADMARAVADAQPQYAHCHTALEEILRADERYLRDVHGSTRAIAIGFSGLPSAPSLRADLAAIEGDEYTTAPLQRGTLMYEGIQKDAWSQEIAQREGWLVRKHVAIDDAGDVFTLTLTEAYHVPAADPTSQAHPMLMRTTRSRYRVAFDQLLTGVEAQTHERVQTATLLRDEPAALSEQELRKNALRQTGRESYNAIKYVAKTATGATIDFLVGPYLMRTWNRKEYERGYRDPNPESPITEFLARGGGHRAGLVCSLIGTGVSAVACGAGYLATGETVSWTIPGVVMGTTLGVSNLCDGLYERYRATKERLRNRRYG